MASLMDFYKKTKYRIKSTLQSEKFLYDVFLPFMPALVKVFRRMAETGENTDLCLQEGFLPVQIHYYSPIPNLSDLEKQKVWDRKSDLAGIGFNPDRQVQLLLELGERYGNECNWSPRPVKDQPFVFYTENGTFSFGCAAALHLMIRNYKPQKIIEVGSGKSSLVISSALELNRSEGTGAEYVIIDPYPAWKPKEDLTALTQVIDERVELMDVNRFSELQENDILFIDSAHTVRTGGDVNFLFLDVLPRLAPGVIVHVHDIGLPYEYPKVYFTNPTFRVFWTEAYILQAFLSCNPYFEVMLAMNYIMSDHRDKFEQAFVHYNPTIHVASSGSFWLRRISG